MKLAEQLALTPLPVRVQEVGLNNPFPPLWLQLTVPAGVLCVPASASVTVAVQLVGWLTWSGLGLHVTVVEVLRGLTVRVVAPLLARWTESLGLYEVLIVAEPEAVGV